MIFIHTFLMVVFIFLWILSKNKDSSENGIMGIFSRMAALLVGNRKINAANSLYGKLAMLNPTKDINKVASEYFIKKTAQALLILFLGNTFALVYAISVYDSTGFMKSYLLDRRGYGEGEELIELSAYSDGEMLTDDLKLTVGEKQYTSDEILTIFNEIEERLPGEIIGENESFDHVNRDLELITALPDYPVSIEWENDDYTVMDREGHIAADFLNTEGQVLTLRAIITYFDVRDEYEIFVRVYPKKRTGREAMVEALNMKIKENDALTVSTDKMVLPSSIGDRQLDYKKHETDTGLCLFVFSLIAAVLVYYGRDREVANDIRKRERELLLCYPEIVSKLTLLIGAGMTIRGAFEKTASDYEKRRGNTRLFAYEEMLIAGNKMRSGVSEFEAYLSFGSRCGISRYNKLGSLLGQNLKKGNTGILALLEEEMRQAFEDRKSMARKLGEEAGTKLLLPMGMMLLIVMVIVIVPAFLSFGI
ncbi:MAG: hypothetical protein K6F99_05060 [Lachnospiraceae bacterium]|nr:hypothetical protein [Lachnospiraceae bacterium]